MDVGSLKPVGGSSSVQSGDFQKKYYESDNSQAELVAKADEKAKDPNAVLAEKIKKSDKNNYKNNSKNNANKENPEEDPEEFQKRLDKAINAANEELKPISKSLSYSVHEKTKEIMIKIKDNKTGEVIKEIPSEESLERIAKMRELGGIAIDEKR